MTNSFELATNSFHPLLCPIPAMVVRFITKRFIGSYDNIDEKLYSYTTLVDNELISFEIIDRPGHFNVSGLKEEWEENDNTKYHSFQTMDLELLKTAPSMDHSGLLKASRDIKDLDTQLKWADAFILVYSVTDKCSFDECNRLKFLINYHKRRRKLTNHKVSIGVILRSPQNNLTLSSHLCRTLCWTFLSCWWRTNRTSARTGWCLPKKASADPKR